MDIRLEQVTQRLVDEPVAGDAGQPFEVRGVNSNPEMAAAVAGASVADMQVAFVSHFEKAWLERSTEALLDQLNAPLGHGSTWIKGLTSAPLQAPAAI